MSTHISEMPRDVSQGETAHVPAVGGGFPGGQAFVESRRSASCCFNFSRKRLSGVLTPGALSWPDLYKPGLSSRLEFLLVRLSGQRFALAFFK